MGVFFKEVGSFGRTIVKILEYLEKEPIRGLGDVYIYIGHRLSIFFIPTKDSFPYNANRYERSFREGVGAPDLFLSLYPSEGISLYPTGNITNSNPLLIPTFTPRRVSPVDPDFLGTLWLALEKLGYSPDILAVHDPPSTLTVPHLVVSFPENIAEDVIFSILASLRRKKVFVPHITVGRAFSATYFYPLLKKRRVPAYHVPYAWSHFLDDVMFEEMKKKGGVRSVLVEKGLVLPGELPQKEV